MSQLLHNIYIGARWNYYLWFIIFIPWFAVWLPLNFLPDVNTVFDFHFVTNPLDTQQQLRYVSMEARFSLSKMIFIFWLLGALLYSFYILFRHYRFISFLKYNSSALTIEQQKMIKNVINNDLISVDRIYLSASISTPMICHIVKSKIYLPDNFFQNYSVAEQKYVLQHECVHYQRCDLITNSVMLILMCLNWFNPLILFSYRHFRLAQELSCDAIFGQQCSLSEKKAYGDALLKVVESSDISEGMSCWWNSNTQLKERFQMLKYHNSRPLKNFSGALLLAFAASIAIAMPNFEKRDITTDMKISNSSKNNLSFGVDNRCSEEIGVINAHAVKVISRERINKLCQQNQSHCVMQAYSTNDCTGASIATLVLDMNRGVISIVPRPHSYSVGGNGFNLFFEGPWV